MSVQNLRNKFSQNNGTVPYNPPGLSYGRPTGTSSSPPSLNNGNRNNGNRNSGGGCQQLLQNGGIGGRFKTIREEPADAADDRPSVATKNHSFLQSYLTNGGAAIKTTAAGVVVHASPQSKYAARPSTLPVPELPPKTVAATVKSPPPSHSVTDTASKFSGAVKSPAPAVSYNPSKFVAAVKSAADASKHTVKSAPPPAPVPDPACPPKLVAKSTLVLGNGSTAALGCAEDRWRTKYEESEIKRKTLLTQSQKREFIIWSLFVSAERY